MEAGGRRRAEEEQAEGQSKAGALGLNRRLKLMIRLDLFTYGLAGADSDAAWGVLGTNGKASSVKQVASPDRRRDDSKATALARCGGRRGAHPESEKHIWNCRSLGRQAPKNGGGLSRDDSLAERDTVCNSRPHRNIPQSRQKAARLGLQKMRNLAGGSGKGGRPQRDPLGFCWRPKAPDVHDFSGEERRLQDGKRCHEHVAPGAGKDRRDSSTAPSECA